ncbi:MAG: nucleotidyltransferase [Cytophagales bacterium]
MTADQYLRTVLAKYSTANGAAQHAAAIANELAPYIREWAGQYLVSLEYSGSYAKKTALAGEADLDLLISLSSVTPNTLQEIYNNLQTYLAAKGFITRRQNVSIGLSYKGYQVDLVPAKRQSQQGNDHSLYVNKKGTWTKTNVHQHITLVGNSSRIAEIQIMKIWRNYRSLDFPSFYLELVVLHALSGQSAGQLANNVWKVLTYIANDFVNARFVDPANSNNVISDLLSQQARQQISNCAKNSLTATNWSQIVA